VLAARFPERRNEPLAWASEAPSPPLRLAEHAVVRERGRRGQLNGRKGVSLGRHSGTMIRLEDVCGVEKRGGSADGRWNPVRRRRLRVRRGSNLLRFRLRFVEDQADELAFAGIG